jgi:hypothetical protein
MNSAAASTRPNLAQEGESLLPHDTAGHQAVKKPVTVDARDSIIRTPYNTSHGVSQLLVRPLM